MRNKNNYFKISADGYLISASNQPLDTNQLTVEIQPILMGKGEHWELEDQTTIIDLELESSELTDEGNLRCNYLIIKG